jgi:WD40 repeat protein
VTEIFISYSRRDKIFVEKFLKALNENGYPADQIWVDWEDIPASSKWEDEIRKGVEKANSIVFILSPEWAISNECAKELKIAAEFNKRFFPIVCQNVDPKTIPAELASLNWIFFRETDSFDEAMQKLLAAIKTDLAWVAQHTFLLSRANEWSAKKRDTGYLLRGNELQEAESWLSHASETTQPRPTPLQSEFIFTSRRDDVRRQRKNLILVSTGLVVSILLAIAAVFSGLEAFRQSQSALAFQLAAQSTNLGTTQPDLSLLLSLEASFIGDRLGGPEAAWLVGGLVTSLNSSPHLDTYLQDNQNAIRTVTFSADGKWLAAAGQPDGKQSTQVTVWDMTSAANPKPVLNFTGPESRILALAFSPDSKRLYGAGDDKKIFVWDPQKCCAPVAPAWDVEEKVRGLVIVELNGRPYIAVAGGNRVTFWDLMDGSRQDALTLQLQTKDPEVRILSLAASPNQAWLAAGSDDGNVTVWDLRNHSIKYSPLCSVQDETMGLEILCHQSGSGRTDVRSVAFSPNSKWLVAGSSDQHVWLWDVETGILLARTPERNLGGHVNTVSSVAFDPADQSGKTLATASWDNTLRLWTIDNSGGDTKFVLLDKLSGHSSSVWTLAYSANGEWLASGSSDHKTILWKPGQISQIASVVDQLNGDVWALTTSPKRDQLAVGDWAGNIHVWDFDGHRLSNRKSLKQQGAVLSLAYSHDDKWLVSAGTDKIIHVWNAQTQKEAWSIPNAHGDEIWSAIFSPDDRWLASASYDYTVKIWDTTTHQLVGTPVTFDDQVYALAFNEDGTQLFVAGYGPDIRRIDLSQPTAPKLMENLIGHQAAVNSLAFHPLYPNILASTSDDKTLLIWDIDMQTDTHTSPVLGLNESMEAVAFRPDGKWLASATDNKTVLLWQWDLKCGEQWVAGKCQPISLGSPLVGHQAPVENVVYLSDTMLVSSSEDGQVILWDLDKAHWYERACKIVNRSFSGPEISQYIEGKVNVTLLHIGKWFAGLFGNGAEIDPPTCISENAD